MPQNDTVLFNDINQQPQAWWYNNEAFWGYSYKEVIFGVSVVIVVSLLSYAITSAINEQQHSIEIENLKNDYSNKIDSVTEAARLNADSLITKVRTVTASARKESLENGYIKGYADGFFQSEPVAEYKHKCDLVINYMANNSVEDIYSVFEEIIFSDSFFIFLQQTI